MIAWETTDRLLHYVATALVTLVIVTIAWGWTALQGGIARLTGIQEVIQATDQLSVLATDMQTLSAQSSDTTLYSGLENWERWAAVPARVVALRPDFVWWSKSSVSLVWKGPMGLRASLDWSDEQGLVLRGNQMIGGSKVLVPPSNASG